MAEFHEELRKIREDRGISREQIVEKIKIRADFLERLEDGDLTFIPMPFVRGFIQEYAKVVGIDPAVALQRLDNKIPTLLIVNEESDIKAGAAAPEKTKVTKEPVSQPAEPVSEEPEPEEAKVETEEEPPEPAGPQTSLFEDPLPEEQPAPEQEPELEEELPQKEKTPPADKEPATSEEVPLESPEPSPEPEQVELSQPEDEIPPADEEPPASEEVPPESPEPSPETETPPRPQALTQEQAEQTEELEKRVPLDIQEAESPGNVAFFIFIAILIILAVAILLMNRGSLF